MTTPKSNSTYQSEKTRANYHFPRRLIHMVTGVLYVLLYLFWLDQRTIIQLVALISGAWYVIDKIRIHHPRVFHPIRFIHRLFFRKDESNTESAAVAYQFAILLTLILFPKIIACAAILTLAISDPMSAFIGIRFGRHKISKVNKSIEGSLAFALTCFMVHMFLLTTFGTPPLLATQIFLASLVIALLTAIFELFPLPVDDNFSIPLATASVSTLCVILCGIVPY